MNVFDRPLARLLLEICRYTYDAGVGIPKWIPGGGLPESPQDYIQNHAGPLGLLTEPPISIEGSSTSFACIVPYPNVNVVSYMGTKTEFEIRPSELGFLRIKELRDLIKNGGFWNELFHAKEVINKLSDFQTSLKDWGQDGKAKLVPFHVSGQTLEGKVHFGFLSEMTAVHQKIQAVLNMHGGTARPLILTGHSQGASEAALATRALAAEGYTVQATYTFAAARAGNQAFVDSVRTPVHRIEYGDDIVPHLPPASFRTFFDSALQNDSPAFQKVVGDLLDHTQNIGYVSLGTLCYGHPDEQRFHQDVPASREIEMFKQRLNHLAKSPPRNWGDHHHLAGTKDQVEHGIRGNYTILVDPDGWEKA